VAKEEAEEGMEPGIYEGGYTAEPEGYDASVEPVTAEYGNEDQPFDEVPVQAISAQNSNYPNGIGPTSEEVSDTVPDADGNTGVEALGQFAMAGEIPPAADEAGLGLEPNAEE
jgi:hypothetical protein